MTFSILSSPLFSPAPPHMSSAPSAPCDHLILSSLNMLLFYINTVCRPNSTLLVTRATCKSSNWWHDCICPWDPFNFWMTQSVSSPLRIPKNVCCRAVVSHKWFHLCWKIGEVPKEFSPCPGKKKTPQRCVLNMTHTGALTWMGTAQVQMPAGTWTWVFHISGKCTKPCLTLAFFFFNLTFLTEMFYMATKYFSDYQIGIFQWTVLLQICWAPTSPNTFKTFLKGW